MTWFLGGILFLIVGYFIYGKIAEKIFLPDDRKTPAVDHPDGVDTLPLPQWKNMLIQLLNIAGVGPVIGVILGIKFGKIALLVIRSYGGGARFRWRNDVLAQRWRKSSAHSAQVSWRSLRYGVLLGDGNTAPVGGGCVHQCAGEPDR